jgi:hypothetical protein
MGNAGKTQMRGAFTAEKLKEDDKKKLTSQLAIDSEFFHCGFANPCKTKGAVGAVWCTLVRDGQLGASLPISVRDGAVTLKG